MTDMSGTATVAMGRDGRAVAVKRGPAQRLRREAMMLRLAARPGVVELVSTSDDGDEPGDAEVELATVFVGGGTLAERLDGQLDGRLAATVASAVAATMAELHDLDIAHRRLSADHILVADGNAVVCGLAEAVLISESDGSVVGDDVVALAQLIDEMAERSTGALAVELRQVARRTLAGSPDARPTMASVTGALAPLLVPTAPASARRLPPRRAGLGRRPSLAGRPSLAPAAVGAIVLGAAALALGILGGGSDAADVTEDREPATAPSPTLTAPASTTSAPPPERLWPGPTCAVAAAPIVADLDGDGCDEEVVVVGGIVSSGGRDWQVAAAGDVVTLGDWDCDGVDTPALLRGNSGELWVYSRWAEGDDQVPAALAGVVPGATSARTAASEDTGCDRIEVVHADDSITVVAP